MMTTSGGVERVTYKWRNMKTAPRDGTRILATDGVETFVCYPKVFPRPVDVLAKQGRDCADDKMPSMPGDVWEYFRDDENVPGHTWSFVPTHWMHLPKLPRQARE